MLWLGLHGPLAACLAVIGAAAAANLLLTLAVSARRTSDEWTLALQLGFDIAQMSAVLVLTGGVLNPFCLLLIAPVTLAAASLRSRYAFLVGGLAAAALIGMSLWSLPPPWPSIAAGRHPPCSSGWPSPPPPSPASP